VRDTYNEIADSYAGLYEGTGPLAHFYKMRLQLLGEMFAQKPVGTMLDVGAGAGIVGDQMRALGYRYVAADQSIGMARECRARADSKGEATVASADALPFKTGAFDVVMALGVVEYLHYPEKCFSECRRVLDSNGTFVVSLLHRHSPFRILQRLHRGLGMDPDPIPPAHFSVSQAKRMLASADFEFMSIRYFDFELLPLEFGQRHPRLWHRITTWAEGGWSGPMRWLGSAFLIEARPA
jgi:SAM-dependent methyltransferase